MSVDQELARRKQELERLGFQVIQQESHCLIAKQYLFHWDCLFTFVNYTFFVRRVHQLTPNMLIQEQLEFSKIARQLNPSPLPRGFQSGNAVFALYLSDIVDEEAQKLCLKSPKKDFAQFYLQGAIELPSQKTYFVSQKPLWGFVYYDKFTYFLTRVLRCNLHTSSSVPISVSGVILSSCMSAWLLILGVLVIATFLHL